MPIIEEYLLKSVGYTAVLIEVERINTRIDGYSFLKSEAKGLLNLFCGANNYLSGLIAPVTNEEMGIRGKAQLKDGFINLVYSPVTYVALAALAFWKYRSK